MKESLDKNHTTVQCTSFYEVWKKLEEFWSKHGVSIIPSYDMEVGAGTYSPYSTLYMMGRTKHSYGFLQRCRRPYDSMGGENGNRLYCFHQMQVMLNPCPDNVIDLFFQSLKHIGMDIDSHEIKFKESDWSSPTIGAYGIGWEVCCDGMEIAQFTHFKKIALQDCKGAITEITYGVERLLLKINEMNNIYDTQWDNQRKYGEVCLEFEKDFLRCQTILPSIATIEDVNDLLEKSKILIREGSFIHGYEQILKACNIYNLMERSNLLGNFQRQNLVNSLQKSFSECFKKMEAIECESDSIGEQ